MGPTPRNFLPLQTPCQCPLPALCFLSLPTIKFRKLFVLLTLQNAPGGCTPLQQKHSKKAHAAKREERPVRSLQGLGNDQRDVVVLLAGAELMNFVHDGSEQI